MMAKAAARGRALRDAQGQPSPRIRRRGRLPCLVLQIDRIASHSLYCYRAECSVVSGAWSGVSAELGVQYVRKRMVRVRPRARGDRTPRTLYGTGSIVYDGAPARRRRDGPAVLLRELQRVYTYTRDPTYIVYMMYTAPKREYTVPGPVQCNECVHRCIDAAMCDGGARPLARFSWLLLVIVPLRPSRCPSCDEHVLGFLLCRGRDDIF